jgi:hypothetical protein
LELHVLCEEADDGDKLFVQPTAERQEMCARAQGYFVQKVRLAEAHSLPIEFTLERGLKQASMLSRVFALGTTEGGQAADHFRTTVDIGLDSPGAAAFCQVSFNSEVLPDEQKGDRFLCALHASLHKCSVVPGSRAPPEDFAAGLISVASSFQSMRLHLGCAIQLCEYVTRLTASCSLAQSVFASYVLGCCLRPPACSTFEAFPGCLAEVRQQQQLLAPLPVGKLRKKKKKREVQKANAVDIYEVEVLEVEGGPGGRLHIKSKEGHADTIPMTDLHQAGLKTSRSHGLVQALSDL